MFRCFLEPESRLHIVFWHTFTLPITLSEVVLRFRVILLGGLKEAVGGLLKVLRHVIALPIAHAEVVLFTSAHGGLGSVVLGWLC